MRIDERVLGLVLCSSVLLAGCGHYARYNPGYAQGAAGVSVPPAYHDVAKGDTLYSICWQYGYDYRVVAGWNDIAAPYTIYPGQRIDLHPPAVPAQPRASVASRGAPARSVARTQVPTHNQSARGAERKVVWEWPTRGEIIATFSSDAAGKKGVDIAGRLGQPIYAAAAGRVVYSGSGLLGYGKLIIIKHNDTYLSAYAHNSRLLVSEDQEVKFGEHIADMGSSGSDRVMLHFEIRRDGKPVNPLDYLPRR